MKIYSVLSVDTAHFASISFISLFFSIEIIAVAIENAIFTPEVCPVTPSIFGQSKAHTKKILDVCCISNVSCNKYRKENVAVVTIKRFMLIHSLVYIKRFDDDCV